MFFSKGRNKGGIRGRGWGRGWLGRVNQAEGCNWRSTFTPARLPRRIPVAFHILSCVQPRQEVHQPSGSVQKFLSFTVFYGVPGVWSLNPIPPPPPLRYLQIASRREREKVRHITSRSLTQCLPVPTSSNSIVLVLLLLSLRNKKNFQVDTVDAVVNSLVECVSVSVSVSVCPIGFNSHSSCHANNRRHVQRLRPHGRRRIAVPSVSQHDEPRTGQSSPQQHDG